MPYSYRSNNKHSSFPLPEDKQEIRFLWQEVFHDSNEFANLFFNRVYKPENTLVVKHNNKIVSALQMIPYEIKTASAIIPSAYVCGVSTHPSEQGKGIMKTLMTEAMEVMQDRNYAISTLIPAEPWLFDFYKKFGYTHPINYIAETYPYNNTLNATETIIKAHNKNYTFTTCTNADYFSFYNRKQRERKFVLLHDIYDFETIIRDLAYEDGNTYVALEKNTPTGIAFAKPVSENLVVVKDILYDHIDTKEALLNYIISLYNVQKIEVHTPVYAEKTKLPAINREVKPYGLACILDKKITDLPDLFMALMLD